MVDQAGVVVAPDTVRHALTHLRMDYEHQRDLGFYSPGLRLLIRDLHDAYVAATGSEP